MYYSDYVHIAGQFAQHLIACGHSLDNIHQLFLEVAKTLSQQPTRSNVADTCNTLFFHWEYHPNGISRRDIRLAYTETCGHHSGFDFDQFVVAFSQP
jgi:hypothetical protein